ncbi:uncharacterized protein LOC129872424 [Solanum dulcamara]|uniref:uncharacterized protein LOC129872424 n=1 Tax=Solanum dulcamara TaxID=45834 RepID=UPI002486845B|nr:uncharacterized protein LOC129872424 [Solanum dulcamara]
MDFITGLPHTPQKQDSIWVIVDRLTKSDHFLPARTTYSAEDYAKLYIKEIVRLHGVPTSIISYRRAQFTTHFWRSFQEGLGTKVTYQLVRCWQNATNGSRHSPTDGGKVSPMKGIMRFGKKGKLSPIYIIPYLIHHRIGKVAYALDLPADLEEVHPVFHVSMLRKCVGDPSRLHPINEIHVTEELAYEEQPIAILDRQIRRLRTKNVASVKVLWQNRNREKMTWKAEEDMRHRYLYLFPISTRNPDS